MIGGIEKKVNESLLELETMKNENEEKEIQSMIIDFSQSIEKERIEIQSQNIE